jgi:hypothetical protein
VRRTGLYVATGASLVVILIVVLLVRNGSTPRDTRAEATNTPSPSPTASPDVTATPSPTLAPSAVPTRPPTPRATEPPPPTPKSTVTVLIVNDFSNPVDVELNGVARKGVKPGAQVPVEVTPGEGGHDSVSVRDTVHTGCGAGDGDHYFDLGNSYRMRVYNTGNNCNEGGTRSPSPGFKIEGV